MRWLFTHELKTHWKGRSVRPATMMRPLVLSSSRPLPVSPSPAKARATVRTGAVTTVPVANYTGTVQHFSCRFTYIIIYDIIRYNICIYGVRTHVRRATYRVQHVYECAMGNAEERSPATQSCLLGVFNVRTYLLPVLQVLCTVYGRR